MLENNSPPTTWNRQNLDIFQNILYRQIEDGKCVSRSQMAAVEQFKVPIDQGLTIFIKNPIFMNRL